ncbi:hypothetical protein R1sor_018004 [Riccia sorocarpa]|uniref:Protein kinase domain-containing protein n=1 Tax=Riccia sorocarpa TaxID=122646 RepID=A0ABD3IB84_9MARC
MKVELRGNAFCSRIRFSVQKRVPDNNLTGTRGVAAHMGINGCSHKGSRSTLLLVVCAVYSSLLQVHSSSGQPIASPPVSISSPPVSEKITLLQFRFSAGLNSENLSSWDWTVNQCTGWYGVKCWSSGYVRALNLPQAELNGTLARDLGGLVYLSSFDLQKNSLTGPIPQEMVSMTALRQLLLQDNQLNGSIPDCLRNMTKLEELNLANNRLEGEFPSNLFATLRNLQKVDLGNNIITGPIPDDLVDIPTLHVLSLRSNNLSGPISPLLASSPSLVTVDLSNNSLEGSLPSTWTMTNMTSLDLSSNFLQGDIPVSLFKLSNLTKLNLAGNNFTGKIPQLMACHYGDAAFSDNPFLVVEPCPLSATPSSPLPDDEGPLPGSAIPPHPVHRRSSNSLSTLTIVALTAGDIALLLMSGAGFVFFISWWKKRSRNNKDDENEDKSANCTLRSVYGKELGQAAEPHRPTYLVPAPALKPALKSVLGKVNEDDQDTEIGAENDFALSCEEFGMDPVILDRRLELDIESLLRANAVVLGAGTFGSVYMAVMDDGHMLAIKRLQDGALRNEDLFARQIKKLADVKHRNLLPIRAYCWSPNEKLIIGDYMPNGNLFTLLHGDKDQRPAILSWATRHNIALETGRALAHLHDNTVVHGNLKATNVLLDDKLEVRVADFGLESLLDRPLQHITNAGYLSPELLISPHRKSAKGDVYSFGVLLLELLTGLEPLGKNNMDLATWVKEMVKSRRTEEVFDPSLMSSHVLPADVLELLELALLCVHDQDNRRPTIASVLRSLETIVPSEGFLPDPAVLPQHMGDDLSVEHGFADGHAGIGRRVPVDSLELSPSQAAYYSDNSSSSISPLQAGISSSSGRDYD